MPSFILTSGNSAAQTLGTGERGFVGRDASIAVSTQAVISTGTSSLTVAGSVVATDNSAVVATGAGFSLTVAGTGLITTLSPLAAAVEAVLSEQATLRNEGEILGQRFGINITRENDSTTTLTNGGLISGQTGIRLSGGVTNIVNAGRIEGQDFGISAQINFFSDAKVSLTNLGTIIGRQGAITLVGDADRVTNDGQIIGQVEMQGSDTTLINRGTIDGTVVIGNGGGLLRNTGLITGAVIAGDGAHTVDARGGTIDALISLGAGNDVYMPGNGDGTVSGGEGIDRLDFRGKAAVTIALDGSFEATGRALGLDFAEFEDISGSAEADHLRGDDGSNFLIGRGGADLLQGAAGVDTLLGGAGKDTLTGGIGNDVFLYTDLSQFGDEITDFRRSNENNDTFQFASFMTADDFIGTLAAGRFLTSTNNVAQDSNDRFIFRTTDATLWFDPDGSGSAAAVMVADMQHGAVVTHLDIVFI